MKVLAKTCPRRNSRNRDLVFSRKAVFLIVRAFALFSITAKFDFRKFNYSPALKQQERGRGFGLMNNEVAARMNNE
jgi:hypothetical protein